MTVNKVDQQVIVCNNENFIKGTYNGINVIIREKDWYINATDMCRQFNKRFAKINENHAWQAYYREFCKEYGTLPEMGGLSYTLNNVIKDLRGSYVHSGLINYISIWASPKYAVVVGKIMDAINEKGIAKGISFDENTTELIDRLNEKITMLKEDIKYRDDYIAKTSVPEENCAKMLYIIIEGEYMKISANSTKVPKTYSYKFTFPASMNVKQILKSRYGSLKKLHISCLELACKVDRCIVLFGELVHFSGQHEISKFVK